MGHEQMGHERTGHKPNGLASKRAGLLGAVSALAIVLVGAVGASPALAGEGCTNEARRVEQRATYLPDCRAYEMVSPPSFETVSFYGNGLERVGYEASISGDRMAFELTQAPSPPGSATGGPNFLSTRGSNGWVTEDEIPPQSTVAEAFCSPIIFYSPDLSKSVLADGGGWGEGYTQHECGHDEPLLVPGEPEGAQNLFLHESGTSAETGFYRLLNLTPPGVATADAWFQAGSADLSHILFNSALRLTPGAPSPGPGIAFDENLYEWAGGTLRLVTILPDGKPVWGLLVGAAQTASNEYKGSNPQAGQNTGSGSFTHALSADGERVFFYAGVHVSHNQGKIQNPYYAGGHLYLRENAAREPTANGECSQAEPTKACTIQIDALQGGAGGTDEPHFQWATPDGSKAFFTDESRLTKDSTAAPGKPDLYEYDLEKPAGQRLTDLTVNMSEPADVQGLSGISDDGAYVYFVAVGALSGEQENSERAKALPGKPNLYLRHAGTTTFIATLEAPVEVKGGVEEGQVHQQDFCDWSSYSNPGGWTFVFGGLNIGSSCMSARVSSNGGFLAFNSVRSLTGYDNAVAKPEKPGELDHEIFLYEAATGKLHCASCDPRGAPPTATAHTGDPRIPPPMLATNFGPFGTEGTYVPGYLTRSLSETGQVFFSTSNALVPADTNGVIDVYEYEGGQLHLISSGASAGESSFEDASVSGNDVFFNTRQAFVPSDTNNAMSLYDARVGGGFISSAEAGPGGEVERPACTSVEACKPPLSEPPVQQFAASSAFSGPGNIVVAPGAPSQNGEEAKKPSCRKGFGRVNVHGKSVCRRARRHGKPRKPGHRVRKGGGK
jgi:hypothetical protein